jgi:hypothetical protein
MEIKMVNYNVNEANFPTDLPPPNEWIIEFNVTHPETRKTILSVRLYVTIKRDGKFGAMG